jgi:plasmid stabilization system protein ParE
VAYRVAFRPEAAADVRAAFAWYERQRPGLGTEFEAALEADLALLREVPTAFPIVLRQLRKLLLRRFPYAIYYAIEADVVRVRGVLHVRQHPRRWRRRA